MASTYSFDPSGTNSANRITNEQHVITAQNFRDYHYVIPNFAPFFEANVSIRMQYPNGVIRPLTLGVDYYFSNQFLDASRACAKPVYGSISFLDTDTAGVLSLSYNTVGGIWNITPAEITRILAEEMRNPRITTWEQITYLPQRFPVVDHEWDLVDMVGASSMVEAIDQVRAAILAANGGGITAHVNDYSNPHQVTKAQVGLSLVQNFAIASLTQAQTGSSNSLYMTPLRVKDAIDLQGAALVNAHAGRTDNPHAVTKAQVQLGNVQDFAVATQAQAEAGIEDDAYMTPLKTSQAIVAIVGTQFSAHAADKLNPHNVTKEQVGLFNVQNYAVATAQEARDGALNDRYMTPLRTTQLVQQFVTVQLDGHATRTDNPHQTTKEQVGLANVLNFPIATQAEAQVATINTAYMTPGRTRDAIVALVGTDLTNHKADTNNPHAVTKLQVGLGNVQNFGIATQLEAEGGTATNVYMTPQRTLQLVNKFVTTTLDGHATRTDNPHATTKDQVGLGNVQNYLIATNAEADAALSTTTYMTPALVRRSIVALATPLVHASNTNNPHAVTAAQVGAYTKGETDTLLTGFVGRTEQWVAGQPTASFITQVLSGTAANAAKLENMTKDQILGQAQQTANSIFAKAAPSYFANSFDVAGVADPVANPFHWMLVGEVTYRVKTDADNVASAMPQSFPDAYWLLTGGHKQLATAALNSAASSPLYIVHAKNSGAVGGPHTFEVLRLNGEDNSDVAFGYTYDSATAKLKVWLKVAAGYNDVCATRLTSLSNTIILDAPVSVEPVGITYVVATGISTSAAFNALALRVTELENTVNSITVA